MGVFDDGYQQSIIDAARNPFERLPAGFLEAFHASYQATRQEDLSISERQNFLDKVKQRNELIQQYTGKPPSVAISEAELLQPGTLSTTAELARRSPNLKLSLSIRHCASRLAKVKAFRLHESPTDSWGNN